MTYGICRKSGTAGGASAWRTLSLIVGLMLCLGSGGCSVRNFAMNQLGDALAAGGSEFGADDDPELIAAAAPFSLKLMESVLAAAPAHRDLRLAAARGFVQYAYAFVESRADELDDSQPAAARAQRERAARLYLRARNHGLSALEAAYPGVGIALRKDPAAALGSTAAPDCGLLYWTGIAWAAAIALGKDDPFLLAELPVAEALVRRSLALDDTYESGAAHVFMISLEMSRAGFSAGATDRARRHYARAVELTGGQAAAPYVTYAEAVSTAERNRAEFEHLLQGVLKMDVNARPEWRLVNIVMQRRARWLLHRTDRFFPD